MRFSILTSLVAVASAIPSTFAGPLAYGICQTGCNVLAGACYAAAGVQFGTIAAPAAPASIMGCNAALGACMAACAVVVVAPTP